MPSIRSPQVRALATLTLALGLTAAGLAYEDERPGSPVRDERVSGELRFFISASGEPEPEEHYLIEVALDSDFEEVVATYDGRKSKAGWAFGSNRGLEDVPEKYRPVNIEGIHYRGRAKLPDGNYYWRIAKALGSGAWQYSDDYETFIVDGTPPEGINSLRVAIDASGNLAFTWDPVIFDVNGNPDSVAGFRVYHYTKVLRKYRTLNRYVVGEIDDTSMRVPLSEFEGERIVFFRVQAVDEVGNEEGRSRPMIFGELEERRANINADQLTDPAYLRRLAAEEGD